MPVTIVPFPRKALKHGLPRRLPRLFELRQTLRMVLKDRRYFYLKQGRSFVGLRDEYPLPHAIEIETINKCNSTCSFCPVNRFADTRPLARMPEELFRKIIDDLASHRYSGLLALYSNNEPFLDKRIFDFAAYARRVLPQATISIFTNGSALDIAKVERILPSLDILRINNYGRGRRGGNRCTGREVLPHSSSSWRSPDAPRWEQIRARRRTLPISKAILATRVECTNQKAGQPGLTGKESRSQR